MQNHDLNFFEKTLGKWGICLSEMQKKQFLDYYELLIEWNSFMNLTAITEFQKVVVKHFLDSLSIIKVQDMRQVHRMIDIGTGAGFPGIPLKILFPQIEVTLLDSLKKRVNFLDEVIQSLKLKEIYTLHGRAEDYGKQDTYREQFDLCVSRAVSNLSSLSEYCLPFVKTGGRFVSYKSGKAEEELKQAKKAIFLLGGHCENAVYFRLADTDMERSFVIIEKIQSTPKKYPRKAGIPTKEPLS